MTEKINSVQLFSLIVLFELGSALILKIGIPVGKYGWVVVILGGGLGCILYQIYVALYHYYPSVPMTRYIQNIWGRYLGWFLALIYILYFLYMAARILRDFTDLLVIMAYRNTSPFIIAALLLGLSMYAIKQGIQTIGRVAFVGLIVLFAILFLLNFFEFVSGLPSLDNLKPIFPRDWRPILHTIFPTALTIPFGEMIAFSMLLPFLDKLKQARKIGIYGIVASCIYLAFSSMMNIMILDEDIVESSIFPLLSSASLINIANFITRVEAFLVITLVILGLFKLLLFFFCTIIGAADILHIKNHHKLIIPIGLLILTLSFAIAPNHIEHIHIGINIVPYYLHVPLQIILPALLFITAFIKRKRKV